MRKLMYVALVPLAMLAMAMVTRVMPQGSASVSSQTSSTMDISELHRSLDAKTIPDTAVDPKRLY